MKILAIETSCDETAIAIIEKKDARSFRVLANIISSQVKLHEKFGGVVPNLARREHEKNLVPVLIRALKASRMLKSKSRDQGYSHILDSILEREQELLTQFKRYVLPLKNPNIDVLAVTYGPGLAPALWTGVNFAKALSSLWGIPLRPVNHMEGHIFSALITPKKQQLTTDHKQLTGRTAPVYMSLVTCRYPAMALLVSGGHTELHLIKKLGNYQRLGETLDDASGEAFDKVAKMLGLKYPGGPEISKQAERGDPYAINFPRPMLKADNFDFSFSGLKTSVLYYLRDHKGSTNLSDVAASFEQAAVDILTEKTLRAAKKYQAKTILIGGGVAANKKLRLTLSEQIKKELPQTLFLTPHISHTGDNALMIALAAVYGEPSQTRFSSRNKKTPSYIGAEPGAKL